MSAAGNDARAFNGEVLVRAPDLSHAKAVEQLGTLRNAVVAGPPLRPLR